MIYSKYSQPAKRGQENWQNIEKIEIGMTVDEVNYIMGDPDTIYTITRSSHENFGKEVYSYYRGPFIYGYLQVIFEPEIDTVIDVLNFIE